MSFSQTENISKKKSWSYLDIEQRGTMAANYGWHVMYIMHLTDRRVISGGQENPGHA